VALDVGAFVEVVMSGGGRFWGVVPYGFYDDWPLARDVDGVLH
jgi:hypothetical protein